VYSTHIANNNLQNKYNCKRGIVNVLFNNVLQQTLQQLLNLKKSSHTSLSGAANSQILAQEINDQFDFI